MRNILKGFLSPPVPEGFRKCVYCGELRSLDTMLYISAYGYFCDEECASNYWLTIQW